MILFLTSIWLIIHTTIIFFSHEYLSELVISFLPYSVVGHITIIIFYSFLIIQRIISKRKMTGYALVIIMFLGGLLRYDYISYKGIYTYNNIPITSTGSQKLTFLYSNIYYKNNNFSGLLTTIESQKPDILMFVEYAKIHDDALSEILKKEYPYKNRYVGGKHFDGDIILSRYPLQKIEHAIIPGSRSFTHVRVKKAGIPLDIALIHTSAPVSPELFNQRNQQMDKLREILGNYYTGKNDLSNNNLIVLGDFNISPWSDFYRTFNANIQTIGLQDISTNLNSTTYNELFPYTRCHNSLKMICSHIDHIWSNNTSLQLQHSQTHGSDHDGFVGTLNY